MPPVVPPTTSPTDDSNEWLVAHNKRREKFHAKYGVTYTPLMWSSDLETSAQEYAEKLATIPGCVTVGGYEEDSYGGENLAANWGSNAPRTPDQVLKYWADDEEPLGYEKFKHFTQVVWRATHYVGCGQVSKGNGNCHIQVCRYLRPGNCEMSEDDWQLKTFAENSSCGPICPEGGCMNAMSINQ